MDHHHHAQPHAPADSTALAELLDLDGDVLHAYLSEVTTWVAQLADETPRRILDLGAGTGMGSIAWARLFPAAEVTAVDRSDELLSRVRGHAEKLGLNDRIRTLQADLDQRWPALEPVDLGWMSASLHELADPGLVLANALGSLRPGGLLAVVEMDAAPRFLPDDLGVGRPGLETRCYQAIESEQTGSAFSHPDWGPVLVQTGFELVAQRKFTVDLSPAPPATGRYARAYLRRIRPLLQSRLEADDLATLDTLLAEDGPQSLLQRRDLKVQGKRTAWIARRPLTATVRA